MAPTRPRPQVAAPQGLKKVHRKPRTQREPSDSWELLDRHELDANADDDVEGLGQSMRIRNPADVDEAMNPLREMADRIGKEVETFAVTLDTYLFSRKDRESSIFGPAHDVVVAFKAIAEEKVHEIKRGHEQEVRAQLKKEWSEQAPVPAASLALAPFTSTGLGSLTTRQAEQVKQLRQWQQEADIWELFRILLELHPSEAKARAARAGHNEKRLKDMGPPHRYVSESDLWERFIIENDLARERYMIKTWLEQTADHQISDVQGIVEELEAKAGRGKGLWSSGWMHTREKIKGEKRLRTWPSAEDSPQPQIRRSDNTELLITTLDPDAPARQSRTLEKPDAYFERAIWVACWEMLRRGSSLEDISAWCEERREGWRALIMGAGLDDTKSASSNVLWRRMCLLASRSGTVTDHEAAVLGQIGGNVKAMERVAYSLDDHLYAHYSAALTQQFDQYLLATNPAKARHSTSRRNLLEDFAFDPEHAQRAINDLITRLRKNASTSSESAQPMKIIQSFLLENEVARLIHTVGAAIAETAALQGPEDMIYLRDREASNGGTPRGEAEVAFNPQTLRIVAHMAIVHRFSSPNTLHGDELLEDENVLVAYIQALRQARKWSLIPNYAAKLQRQRYILVMGRVLQDVRDAGERTEILELLEANRMDIVSILQEQLAWHLDMAFPSEYAEKPLTILEPAPPEKAIYPGYRINEKFLPTGAVEGDDAVIRALEWFLLLKGGWEVTFKALAIALRKCLVTGRLACAVRIVNAFPYDKVSQDKAQQTMGAKINPMDWPATLPQDDLSDDDLRISLMRRQSRTFHELSQLVSIVQSFHPYRREEAKYADGEKRPATVPRPLKDAKDVISANMEPLLHGILQHPVDDVEAADLAYIRLAYVPEVVITYVVVLYAAGRTITRDALLDSMELSGVIANSEPGDVSSGEPGNGLAEVFVQAGRMRELVEFFAKTAKSMLVLKAEGKPWRPKKGTVGKDLGMWEIGGGGEEL